MVVFVRHPALLGGLMVFCAGGILYLIFQDVAPQAKLERHWTPSLGAVGGFLLGLIGYMITGGQAVA
jgi:ZIP family zinc transporter